MLRSTFPVFFDVVFKVKPDVNILFACYLLLRLIAGIILTRKHLVHFCRVTPSSLDVSSAEAYPKSNSVKLL